MSHLMAAYMYIQPNSPEMQLFLQKLSHKIGSGAAKVDQISSKTR